MKIIEVNLVVEREAQLNFIRENCRLEVFFLASWILEVEEPP